MMKNNTGNPKRAMIKDINLMSLGWELALPIFAGALIGYFIDRQFNTQYFFSIGLLLSGIGIGYYNIYKYIEIESLRLKASRKTNTPKGTSL